MLFRIVVDQIDHLYLTFAMFYKYHQTYQPLLMEVTFDVCSYLKKYNSMSVSSFASIGPSMDLDQTALFILNILEKNNPQSIRKGCPYRVSVLPPIWVKLNLYVFVNFRQGVIAFENFYIDESMAPHFLPAGEYRLDMRYFNEKNQTVMHSQVFGSVRAVGLVDLSMG